MRKEELGWAELEPKESVIAGSMCSWMLIYHVGKIGIDDGGSIRIARRSVSDEQNPQFNHPKASGYTKIGSTGKVRLEYFYSNRGHIRPFRRALQVDVRDGSLGQGDEIRILYGDRSQGSPGIRAQTFREEEHIFKVLVDPFGTGKFEEILGSPFITVKGGPADRIDLVAPSQVRINQPFNVTVRCLDSYGNRSDDYSGRVKLSLNEKIMFEDQIIEEDRGTKSLGKIELREIGTHRLKIEDDSGRKAESNPISVVKKMPDLKLFWGDMHGQTKQTVGTGTVDEYFSFLRDVAAMDFGGWQGNDFQITNELWEEVQEKTKRYHAPGNFVLFLGYEWSGLTPAGGDHNIYFLNDDEKIHRSNHWLINDKSDEETDRYPISELWKEFTGRKDVMAIPHIGGRYANLNYFDAERIPLIEVHSHHGTFEWFLDEALKRGLKVGFIAASDDHTCRPGLTGPSEGFTTKGGYTGVYAKELTRKGLWEAFWARRCYGTTGERVILDFKIGKHHMGEEFSSKDLPEIKVKVIGTAPLHEVEVKRGTETIHRHQGVIENKDSNLIKIEWMGARVKSRPKIVDWNGGLYLNKGRILEYHSYSFDYPGQGIKQINNQRIDWDSTTGGDADGIIMKLDAPEDAEITFYSKPKTFSFKPSSVENEPMIIELGEVNKKIKITKIPSTPLPKEAEFTYKDEAPKKGVNAYWIKVTQSNGALAWSSPIYFNYQ